jgi:hypothetical protein
LLGGAGTDSINLAETTAAIDQIHYSETGTGNVDSVSGFSVAGKDAIGFTLGPIAEAGFGNVTLSRGSGADVTAAVAAGAGVVVNVAQNVDVANSATALILKLTTPAASFAAAVGTGSFAIADANFGSSEAMFASWFDSGTNEAVFGTLRDSSTAAPNELQAADTFTEAARVAMSAADYASLLRTISSSSSPRATSPRRDLSREGRTLGS